MKPLYLALFLLGFVSVFGSITGWTLEKNEDLISAVAFLIDREPGHPKKGDVKYAAEIGEAIESAALEYGENQWILTSMAHWESRFRPDVLSLKKKGPADEKGLLQCGKKCAANCPYFLDTVKGQALCGAYWLNVANVACNAGDKAALTYYASGEACKIREYQPKKCLEEEDPEACYQRAQSNLRAKVNRRINLANKLQNQFGR